MKGKAERYRELLRTLRGFGAWESLLLTESALPGPRANLELLAAAVEEGDRELFLALLERAPARGETSVPTGDSVESDRPDPRMEFLAACGAAGLGRLLAEGDRTVLPLLRGLAHDPRWRVREGVALALQRWGDADPDTLLSVMRDWSRGDWFDKRAVVAGLCEPRLLDSSETVGSVLALLDGITVSVAQASDRHEDGFLALRKALAYGWSVAIVADLAAGLPLLERWLAHPDREVSWIMRQNMGKARLQRAVAAWEAKYPRVDGDADASI